MHLFAIYSVFRNGDSVAHQWLNQLFQSLGGLSRLKMRSKMCSLFLIPSLPIFSVPNTMAALEVKQAAFTHTHKNMFTWYQCLTRCFWHLKQLSERQLQSGKALRQVGRSANRFHQPQLVPWQLRGREGDWKRATQSNQSVGWFQSDLYNWIWDMYFLVSSLSWTHS